MWCGGFYFLPFDGYLCYNNVDIKRAHRRVMALGSSQKFGNLLMTPDV